MTGTPVAVRLEGVVVERSRRRVLGPLDLRVDRGGVLVVAGSNGAGKTTLLLLLLGLLRQSAGSVRVLGAELGSRAWTRLRRGVGYVNQESVRTDLPITAREVVEIGTLGSRRRDRARRLREAMEHAGCAHLEARPYRELSGGEKQRVAIARCLTQDPSLVLLDEPTAFLDPVASADLARLLERLNREGLTIIAATHELDRFAGWPLVHLAEGRVAERAR